MNILNYFLKEFNFTLNYILIIKMYKFIVFSYEFVKQCVIFNMPIIPSVGNSTWEYYLSKT